MKYSPSARGFFDESFAIEDIPDDAIKISDELYFRLLEEQSTGRVIMYTRRLGVHTVSYESTLTKDDRIDRLRNGVAGHLSEASRAKGYDSIIDVVSYADEPSVPRFQQDGIVFRRWRSLVWDKYHQIIEDWKDDKIEEPQVDEVIAQLPKLEIK